MSSPKTVLFVPGAWHSPQAFAIVGKHLQDAGYKTRSAVLPSVGAVPPLNDFSQDVAKIKGHIQSAVDAGEEIILVCHSYGGIPSSEAIKGLDFASRQKEGLSGGVSHCFYCCAWMLPVGESLASVGSNSYPPWLEIRADKLVCECKTPAEAFYNDMTDNEAEVAISTLKHHSYQTFHSQVTYAAWKEVPTTYLYCLKDAAIPYELQKIMVEQFAKDVNIRTETLDASHSPFISRPVEVAAAIRRAAGEDV